MSKTFVALNSCGPGAKGREGSQEWAKEARSQEPRRQEAAATQGRTPVCSVQCAVCSVQCDVCSVQCAVYSLKFAVCNVSMLCAVCSVQ